MATLNDQNLDVEARQFLRDTVGIQLTENPRKELRQEWRCLSCLLTQVYDLFCRAGPEGDTSFYREVERTKFERVSKQESNGQ